MNRCSSFQTGQSKYVNISHISRITAESFSDHEILVLNDLLLSSGLHTIAVKNLSLGRNILDLFVTLLNQYRSIYWLSHKSAVPGQVYDLYTQLEQQGCLRQRSVEVYEAYFYEEFYGDLLVIECTPQLMQEQWYADFEQAIFQTGLCERIPVVQIMYGCYQ